MVRWDTVELLALDFDGTLTLGAYVIFAQDGTESVVCSRRDSLGIELLQQNGIEVVVISKESNPVVTARCKKMNIECIHQGAVDAKTKVEILKAVAASRGIAPAHVCYGGDDVNDIDCLKWAGIAFSVADGQAVCHRIADYVTVKNGGDGAVREVCDLILEAKGVKT